MNILIKNGTIVTSSDTFRGDLFIEGEKISAVATKILLPPEKEQELDQIIDAEGKYIIPGGIDVHTHFQLPVKGTVSMDDFESGSRAGACGGITTFIDFAHQVPGQSALKAIEDRLKEAEGNCFIDYGFHLGISDFKKDVLKELPLFVEMGIPSFKLYMIYAKEGWMSDDSVLWAMLTAVKETGGIILVHAENPFLIDFFTEQLVNEGKIDIPYHAISRPNFVEAEAIRRALYLTEITESRIYFVHVSTGEGVAMIAEAKGRGIMAFSETCPQYLLLTDEMYARQDGYLYTCSPPLRKEKDQLALWKGLSMGAIQVVATDTCTFSHQQREVGKNDFTKLPGGLPGIETMVPLMFSEGVLKGRISLNQWVELISANPAKLFGLYPQKGSLAPGADADVVIFDPRKEVIISADKLHYRIQYSPYEGVIMTGAPQTTILRGKIIYENGEFLGQKGYGKFVPRYYAQ